MNQYITNFGVLFIK